MTWEGTGAVIHGDPLHTTVGPDSFWTTTNLAEAFPGVLSPLGATVACRAVEIGGRAALSAIGALAREEAGIPSRAEDRIFGVFFGRIAARVDFFFRVGDLIPGTTGEAVARQILGFVPPGLESHPSKRRYPAVATRFPATFLAAPRRTGRARRDTDAWWQDEIGRRPSDLAAARAQFTGGFDRFVANCIIDGTALLAGTQPVYDQLIRLAEAADVPAAPLMSAYGSHEESRLVSDLWACSRGRLDLDVVVQRHGYHGPGEGEISGTIWREDRSPLIRVLDAYRALPDDGDPGVAEAARREERFRAERTFLAALPPAKRAAGRLLLRLAHVYLPLRGKVARLQALDVARAAARRVGECLAGDKVLAEPEDVFFLTADEIRGTLRPGIEDIVSERRTRYEYYRTLELPSFWQGAPQPTTSEVPPVGAARPTEISGLGVSPGVVEGLIRVVEDPASADVEPGEILVAHTTDPSWASIMFVSSALIVDIGGLLSHAAVVARELGVPCVMGTESGTSVLRTGDLCRVDGTTGRIEVLKHAAREE